MAKPSFTQVEQVEHLSNIWGITKTQALEMLRQVRKMDAAALAAGDRVYWDDFGTLHVQIKPPTYKKLPGDPEEFIVPARVNVKFEESKDLVAQLNQAFADQLERENQRFENG